MTKSSIKLSALQTLQIEIDNLQNLYQNMDDAIVHAVQLILDTEARVIISGIGKSAIIAQKIVSTLNSTGTPSIFMHAADAVHGDLGMIQKNDIVIILSNSGNTPEIKSLVPLIKNFGNKLIAFTGNKQSFLGLQSDIVINCNITKEACPLNLAPTSSTTAQMVMGDALAVALINARNFSSHDFSKYHPGGALGKRLYTTVGDICAKHAKPFVENDSSFMEVINEISSKRLGATAVLENGKLIGLITDGDIRRAFQQNKDIKIIKAADIMTKNPRTILSKLLASSCVNEFNLHKISQLVVVNDQGEYEGIIHIHDLSREEIV